MVPSVQNDSSEFEIAIDAFFAEKMAAYHIPGAVLVIVQDGKIILAKGYGMSEIDQHHPVSPEKTLFHLGSISKLITATAVMQLVERGDLDLHSDINQYLNSFQIDATYPEPVTLFHLLTHTSGLEQHGIGTGAHSAGDFVDMPTYLQQRTPQRLVPPGEVIIYSSVGIAIAGQVMTEISGKQFAKYVRQHLFDPLNMTHSTFVVPPNYQEANKATGYRFQNGEYIPYTKPYYSLVAPGGDFVSTGLDMANFMMAHLEGGRLGEVQILEQETVQYMQAQQVTHHPKLRGRAIGFSEWIENGQRAIFHDGGAPGFLSRVFIVPEHRLGIFLAYNNGNAYRFKQDVTSELLDLYFPYKGTSEELPATEPNLSPAISEFAGHYRDYELSPLGIGKLSSLLNQIPVSVIDDQKIRIGSTEYIRVAPALFQTPDGKHYAAFRMDSGEITHLLLGTASFEKVNWYETQPIQTGLLIAFGLTFLIAIFSPLFTSLNRQTSSLFRWYASLICLLNLAFLIGLTLNLLSILEDPWSLIYGITPALESFLIMPFITAVLTLGLTVLTFLAWRNQYWSLTGRIFYTWVTIVALGFIPFLLYWNLLV
jgi:CubicO group peptidase (beta-lactamase class C family)